MMYRKIAERFVDEYNYDWAAKPRMKEACICSVEIFCSTLINAIIILSLACLLSKEIPCIIFVIVNGTTRLYSGGRHAKNYLRCILTYTALLLISVYTADYMKEMRKQLYILVFFVLVFSVSINIKYGGMQRQLENWERKKNRKICGGLVAFYNIVFIIVCITELITGISMGLSMRNFLYVGCFALLIQAALLYMDRKQCINHKVVG